MRQEDGREHSVSAALTRSADVIVPPPTRDPLSRACAARLYSCVSCRTGGRTRLDGALRSVCLGRTSRVPLADTWPALLGAQTRGRALCAHDGEVALIGRADQPRAEPRAATPSFVTRVAAAAAAAWRSRAPRVCAGSHCGGAVLRLSSFVFTQSAAAPYRWAQPASGAPQSRLSRRVCCAACGRRPRSRRLAAPTAAAGRHESSLS